MDISRANSVTSKDVCQNGDWIPVLSSVYIFLRQIQSFRGTWQFFFLLSKTKKEAHENQHCSNLGLCHDMQNCQYSTPKTTVWITKKFHYQCSVIVCWLWPPSHNCGRLSKVASALSSHHPFLSSFTLLVGMEQEVKVWSLTVLSRDIWFISTEQDHHLVTTLTRGH